MKAFVKNGLVKFRLRTWVALGLIILMLPVVIFSLFRPHKSEANWFNDNWAYRQSWSFTHNAALSDQRVSFTISNTNTLVTATKMLSSCNDVRFTDSNGRQLLIQLISGCNSASTVYDVIIPSVVSGVNAGYLYYGNPQAPSVSMDISGYTSLSPSGGAPAFGSEEKGTIALMYWGFDEGYGTTSHDQSSNQNTGTLGGTTKPTWQTDDLCIVGKCLFFDGASSKVTGSVVVKNIQSVAFWVRPNAIATQGLLNLDGGTHVLSTNSSGVLTATGFTSPTYYLNGNSVTTLTLVRNSWNYVVITTGTGFDSTSTFTVGTDGTNFQTGFFDEVKFYNYARSADQVKADFNARNSGEGVAAQLGQASTAFLNSGLVGYWKLDETVTPSLDSSGNSQSGTWTNNPTSNTGKFNQGISLSSASSQYITIADTAPLSPTTAVTVSAWIGPTTNVTSRSVIVKDTAYRMTTNSSSQLVCEVYSGGAWQTAATGSTTLTTGVFQMVACTYDGQNVKAFVNGVQDASSAVVVAINDSAAALEIGRNISANYFSGVIDEARVYSRALSNTEVYALYNWGPGPVTYLKLDENTGTSTANDSSTYANSGTLQNFTTTSWSPGKLGSALTFNGTTSDIKVGDSATTAIAASFTLSAWINPNTLPGASKLRGIIAKTGDLTSDAAGTDSNYTFVLDNGLAGAGQRVDCSFEDSGHADYSTTFAITLTTGVWTHLECVFNDPTDTISIYVNGVLSSSATVIGVPTTNTNDVYVGVTNATHVSAIDEYFDGKIDDAKIYSYPRSPSQVIEDMNGGHPVGGSPFGSQLLFWKLDEQSGNTINNSGYGGTTYNGTNSGAAWLTNTSCKANGCLNFDTTTDNVTAGDLSFIDSLAGLTTSFWLNPQTLATNKMIISKANNTTQRVFQIKTDDTTAAKLKVMIASTASDTSNYCVTAASVLTASVWQQVTVVYDGTQATGDDKRVKVYINGTLASCTVTGTIPATLTSGTTSALKIGQGDDTTPTALLTYMDGVKVYNTALTSDQVKTETTFGSGINFGTGQNEATNDIGSSTYPSLYWPLDENTGGNATDISGNASTGTTTTGTAVAGKVGPALSLTATSSNVSAGDLAFVDGLTGLSVSIWLNPQTLATNNMIISKANTATQRVFQIKTDDTTSTKLKVMIASTASDTSNYCVTANAVFATSTWKNVQVVYDGSQSTGDDNRVKVYINGILSSCTVTGTIPTTLTSGTTSAIKIGQGDDATPTALLAYYDDVKIYNYARSQKQISYDYNRGGPIAWWKLDDNNKGNSMTENDSSGNAFTATSHYGANATGMDCTVAGKYNYGCTLDGTDDYLSVTDAANIRFDSAALDFSVFAWVKRAATGSEMDIVSKEDADNDGYRLEFTSSDTVRCSVNSIDVDSSSTITDTTTWHLVGCTISRAGNGQVYIDGRANGTAVAISSTAMATTTDLAIGARSYATITNYQNGTVDDVRLYNYVLSQNQINKVYNEGAGARFGPLTGTPLP